LGVASSFCTALAKVSRCALSRDIGCYPPINAVISRFD
jgi:hypothetical protein